MRILEDGHQYALRHLESDGEETLTFCKRSGGPVEYDDDHPGTTTQEVLRALIQRTRFVDDILQSDENLHVLLHLRKALFHLEARAWRRKQQKINRKDIVEDDMAVPFDAVNIEHRKTCNLCGHILCDGNCRQD